MNLISSFLIMLIFTASLSGADMLKPGQTAPDFSLKDANGKIHKLSAYKGKTIVLYFYPKDDTPGCTAEACNLRDNYESLLERNIVVLGVSFDDSVAHQKFIQKYELPFPLLSDTDKKVAELYNASRGAMLNFIGAKRITYLIDEQQKILHIFNNVQTKTHAAQIMEILGTEGKDK